MREPNVPGRESAPLVVEPEEVPAARRLVFLVKRTQDIEFKVALSPASAFQRSACKLPTGPMFEYLHGFGAVS